MSCSFSNGVRCGGGLITPRIGIPTYSDPTLPAYHFQPQIFRSMVSEEFLIEISQQPNSTSSSVP